MNSTLPVTFGGVASIGSGSWLAHAAGSTPAVAPGSIPATASTAGVALVLLGVALLGLSAGTHWIVSLPALIPSSWSRAKPAARKLGAVVFALALVSGAVTSGIAPSPVGGAAADHNCSPVSEIMTYLSGPLPDLPGCGDDHVHPDVQAVKDAEDSQTALDIYSAATAVEQRSEEYNTFTANWLQDVRTTAYSKGQAAAMEAMNAGKSESEVKAAGRQAVKDYYTKKQQEVVKSFTTRVQSLADLSARAANESGVSNTLIHNDGSIGDRIEQAEQSTATYTLLNGSTLNVWWPTTYVSQYDNRRVVGMDTNNATQIYYNWWSNDPHMEVESINSSYPGKVVLDASRFTSRVQTIGTDAMMVSDNVAKWANGTYDEYNNGNLNASEYVDPTTLAQEYSTNYNDTGYFSYAVASLSMAGLETPNLNETSHMVVSVDGTEYTGLLMSQYAPDNGTWKAEQTYDGSVIQGQQLFITSNGTKVDLEQPFYIKRMENLAGESIDTTQVVEYNYQAVNTTEYRELQDNITDLRNAIEAREPQPPTGGGSDGSIPPWALGAGGVLAVLSVIAVATRE